MSQYTILYASDALKMYPKRDAPLVCFLNRAGFTVLTAASGTEAEGIIGARKAENKQIDAMITDYFLSDDKHNGRTLAPIFKSAFPDAQLVFCTACAPYRGWLHGKIGEFEGAIYMAKPILPSKVTEFMEKMRDRKMEMSKLPDAGTEIQFKEKVRVKGVLMEVKGTRELQISVIRPLAQGK